MLNYSNLNDVEFEYLCKDIMSRILDRKLERFGSGRDHGIDLTDDAYRRNIIVQVKHYTKTDVRGLIGALRNEVPKVKRLNPQKYYVCCSKELTPDNKSEIFELFSEYMESTENILSLVEINDFLDLSQNADILRKHFKLWIESTNVLTNALTNDVFIDSEGLLYGLEKEAQLFVRTTAFDHALSVLEQQRVLIIVGNPGVGKSITSKMLVLYYVALNYHVRYTTDGSDLAALKRALSQSPEAKEIILLDDCFGQAYFSMKASQENELLALMMYVNSHPNKLLIMNSRVTIFQEAQARTPRLVSSLDRKEYAAYVLNMDAMPFDEKAKIFYNHLYFCELPKEYRDNIISKKNYRKIVKHRNYNPRIIEFVCLRRQWSTINPNDYAKYILQCLDTPNEIWRIEYERKISETDRMLLTTLYSLTNTTISLEFIRACYNFRIIHTPQIDTSINHFDQALARLSDSMIKLMDVKGQKMLSVANPSVNDFLSAYLNENIPEKQALIQTSCSVRQLKRLLDSSDYSNKLNMIFADKSILSFLFESEQHKLCFIAFWCSYGQVLDTAYRPYIESFLKQHKYSYDFGKHTIYTSHILMKLFDDSVCEFYELGQFICRLTNLERILGIFGLQELSSFIQKIDHLFTGEMRFRYVDFVIRKVEDAITMHCTDVPATAYDIDIGSFIDDYYFEDENGWHIDADGIAKAIDECVQVEVQKEVEVVVNELPTDIIIDHELAYSPPIVVDGSSLMVERYLYDYCSDFDPRIDEFWDDEAIDRIFE